MPERIVDLLQFERLLTNLSTQFISLPATQVDSFIDRSLQAIVEALGIDRSVLLGFRPDKGWATSGHSWTRDGLRLANADDIALRFPWASDRIRRGQTVAFSATADLPPEAAIDKANWDAVGVKSHVSVPLVVGDSVEGLMTFASQTRHREWSPELVARLRVVAEVFSNALGRKRAQEETFELLHFEHELADVAASLMTLQDAQIGEAIGNGLGRIARCLAIERVVLWELDLAEARFGPICSWPPAGDPSPLANVEQIVPWMCRQARLGNVVRLGSLAELPDDAAVDRASLDSLGTQSMLVVPLNPDGVVTGAISLATISAERQWPDVFVPRVRLLGEVVTAAITRQRAEQRVQEAQREAGQNRERLAHLVRVHTVGAMSAGIAHEINQPLVAIENYALAARRHVPADLPGSAKLRELLDKIVAQSSRAGDVIKHLRGMVRRHELEVARLDLSRIVASSVRFAEMEGHLRDMSVELRLPDGLPSVLGDEIHIQQVVLNLVRNAIEATEQLSGDAQRSLRIEVGLHEDNRLFVQVADNGPGFAEGDAERLFEPFYSTKSSGLGIGLSLCRTIVEAHGGHLRAWQGVAGGAVFEFTLPRADDPQ
jgi:signal transduction histidine kinase